MSFFVLEPTEFCCDVANIQGMANGLDEASVFFARCPTCLENMEKYICEMTCAKDQSKYMTVLKTEQNAEEQCKLK